MNSPSDSGNAPLSRGRRATVKLSREKVALLVEPSDLLMAEATRAGQALDVHVVTTDVETMNAAITAWHPFAIVMSYRIHELLADDFEDPKGGGPKLLPIAEDSKYPLLQRLFREVLSARKK